jgi:hypothetical protein
MNKEINYAKEYHEETKHSEISIQLSRHYLDWNNKPLPFKIYSRLPSISLPKDFPQPTEGASINIDIIQGPIRGRKTITFKTTKDHTTTIDVEWDIGLSGFYGKLYAATPIAASTLLQYGSIWQHLYMNPIYVGDKQQ